MVWTADALDDEHAELSVHDFEATEVVERSVRALLFRELFGVELRLLGELEVLHIDPLEVTLDAFDVVRSHVRQNDDHALEYRPAEVFLLRVIDAFLRDVMLAQLSLALFGLLGKARRLVVFESCVLR